MNAFPMVATVHRSWLCAVLLCACTASAAQTSPPYFDVRAYGAEGDGITRSPQRQSS